MIKKRKDINKIFIVECTKFNSIPLELTIFYHHLGI